MPPKRRKFESTFPAARIKKIMQLDDDVGRVASSVPVVISRAVEIFLQALLTRGADYAATRNAKTLTVGHLKHCIEQEKQWDFLRELTAKISDITAQEDSEEATGPKRGRKRKGSPQAGSSSSGVARGPTRRKQKTAAKAAAAAVDAEEGSGSSEEGAGTTVDHSIAGRGMFSQYFSQASSSSSASPSLSHNSRQEQPSTSSHPLPLSAAPPSLPSLSSHPPTLITSSESVTPSTSTADLSAMTAGLRNLPRGTPGDEEEEENYDE